MRFGFLDQATVNRIAQGTAIKLLGLDLDPNPAPDAGAPRPAART